MSTDTKQTTKEANTPKGHHPPTPTTENQPSLGEQQPDAPFSLMTFTYPLLLIVAMFVLGLIYWFSQTGA